MRKKIALFLTVIMVLSLLPLGSFADEHLNHASTEGAIAFTVGEAGYWMGDTWVESDATPYIQADRIMVPVAHASRALGAAVTWQSDTKEVEVTHNNDTYTLTIGSTQLQKNGELLEEMDTIPVIQNIGNGLGRTMLPVSRLAKVLNVDYTWDAATQTATFMPLAEEGPVVYDEAGTFGPEEDTETIDNDVIISADGVILQNLIITGNLTITEEVGEGDVTLNNITVEGDTFIQGGGTDSIHINGGSYGNIIVQRTPSGALRVVVTGQNRLNIEVDEKAEEQILILEGFYDKVIVTAPNVRIITRGETQINELVITGAAKNTTLETSEDTTIEKAVVDGEGTVFEGGEGTVKEVEGDEKDNLEDLDDVVVQPSVPSGGGGGSSSNDNDEEDEEEAPAITEAEVSITSGSIVFGYTFYDGAEEVTYLEATQAPYHLDALNSHVELINGDDNVIQHFQQLNVSDDGQVVYEDLDDIIASWWNDPTDAFVPSQIRIYLTPTDQGEWDAFEVVRDLTQDEANLFMSEQGKEIVSVKEISNINVAYGTALESAGLPQTVEVTLEDASNENLAVTWDDGTPIYDSNTAGTYAFKGTITLPAGIANSAGHEASVNVIVATAPNYTVNVNVTGGTATVTTDPATEATAGETVTVTITNIEENKQFASILVNGGAVGTNVITAGEEYTFEMPMEDVTITVEIEDESEFAGGTGTSSDPYQVETANHLNNVRNHLDKHFIQIADIDLGAAPWSEGEGWEPIGSQLDTFRGSYNGNEYTISNLNIKPSSGSMDSGLFGYLGNGGVISSSSVTGIVYGYEQTGLLVGRNNGSIIDSSAIGEVSGTNTVGGLVGSNLNSGVITGSYSQVEVNGSGDIVGGFVGLNAGEIKECYSKGEVEGIRKVGGLVGANTGEIDESFSSGKVTGDTSSSDTDSGGLVGVNSGSINNSYSLGNVIGYRFVGGLVGRNRFGDDGNISNSYSTGTVTGTEGVGGLIGHNPGTVTSSYWDTVSSGTSDSAGGEGKITAEMKDSETYTTDPSNWDFTTIWGINPDENNGYPFLRW